MKKIILLVALAFTTLNMSAQGECFEGEIVYETFEHHPEWEKNMSLSVNINGVQKMRLIVKGSKMHLINETTQCHTVVNDAYTN